MFDEPSAWRRARRGGGASTEANHATPEAPVASMTCAIKGNISASGERIYHLPDSATYTRTIIDERAGERMSCSEDEAKAAGWRAPRG